MIGEPLTRVDGRAKVTGAAKYAAEFTAANVVYGAIVSAGAVAHGRVRAIDVSLANAVPGVFAILTHENAPRVAAKPKDPNGRVLRVLQDDLVLHDRQPIALVVADTFEHATSAASLVRARIEALPAVTSPHAADTRIDTPDHVNREETDYTRGDPEGALARAAVEVEAIYTLPSEYHNPMELHSTIAHWEGDRLTVYDATQGVFSDRQAIANALGLPQSNVRVIAPFVGGGFGGKGSTQAHQVLAAMGAQVVKRPVKVVLTRAQMFGFVGYRPELVQRVALGADRDGRLVATIHDVTSQCSLFDTFVEPSAVQTRMLYACPNLRSTHRLARINASTPTYMRAPGESSGTFALESAMDELAYATQLDPIELRLRNYAETDPQKNLAFSSKSLRECYRAGAQAFGWNRRTPQPRSMSDDGMLIGLGMATATYPTNRSGAGASATIHPDGSVLVQSGGAELGTGAYTVFTQVAAETLGLPVARVRFELGDTAMPHAPNAGGSQLTASVGSAVKAACGALRTKLTALAQANGTTYDAFVASGGVPLTTASAESAPGEERKQYSMHAFGAQFAEVQVDPDFGTIRVRRFVGAFASGRILNAKTAHSQYVGGIVWGIGMALLEGARVDRRLGRVMNADLAEYLVPVNADVPAIEAILVDEEDRHVNPIGAKGIGEIGITGVAGAIANAVYHATGVRVRDLPIVPEKLLLPA